MIHRAQASPYRFGITALVCALGVTLSILTWRYVARGEEERTRTAFLSRAQTQATVAAQHLLSYGEMVQNLRDTFIGQKFVTRREFSDVSRAILARHAGVQALQWVRIVSREERANFEKTAGEELGHPFTIRRRLPDGTMQPAPESDEYWVIDYVEPLAGNEPVLGYDLTSAPTAALLGAARTDRDFKVSPTFRLLQSHADRAEPGVVFVLPFVRSAPSGTPVEGFVQGVFFVRTMLGQSHKLMTNEALDTYYFDVTDDAPPSLLYANLGGTEPLRTPTPVNAPALDDPADYHETLTLGGRRWLMLIRQNAAWARTAGSRQPEMILGCGLAITALLSLFIHSLLQRTARIESEVGDRTRQLHASEARLQAILDHSPAVIFLKDTEGRYLLCNRKFEEANGRPRTELLGRKDEDFSPADDARRYHENDAMVMAAGRPMQFEESAAETSRSRIYLTHKFPLFDEQGRAYALCGIATDITDRKIEEERRLAFERKLLESQKLESLGVLAGGVAHDFNNILTSILGNASLAALDLPETHRALPLLLNIERASNRAADLCSQMLAYAGRSSHITTPVNLSALVQDTAALLEISVGKRVRLDLQPDPTVPAVMGDPTQLRQIVMNLIMNAADAIGPRPGGLVIVRTFVQNLTTEVFAKAVQSPRRPAGLYVGLEVTDNGSGIPPAVLARIFEPFFTTKFSGRGLGLAATLGIVQSHQGAILVDSQPDQGTTFRLFLPATTTPAPASAPPMATTVVVLHGTVLVVDDEEPVRLVAEKALTGLGVTVLLADSGARALELIRSRPDQIDLVLLDLTMPGLGGDEVLRQLRQIRPDLPVLVMSGYSEGETILRCASLKIAGYLPKPFDFATLVAKIQPILG